MPSLRSVARWLLTAVGALLVVAGTLLGASVFGSEEFPAGLALGFALLVVAVGGAALGGAALLSGGSLRPAQRAGLKVAGVLAVAAFVLPAVGVFVVPGLLYDWFGADALAAPLLAWLYLSAGSLALGVAVALWRTAELAYGSVTS